jgi:acylphosphatase
MQATKFRKLNGMMSNPDGSDGAEIYVEGKRNQVEGFLRWCKKADKKIGMSQVVQVVDVVEEEATGLYDSFYCKVKA